MPLHHLTYFESSLSVLGRYLVYLKRQFHNPRGAMGLRLSVYLTPYQRTEFAARRDV